MTPPAASIPSLSLRSLAFWSVERSIAHNPRPLASLLLLPTLLLLLSSTVCSFRRPNTALESPTLATKRVSFLNTATQVVDPLHLDSRWAVFLISRSMTHMVSLRAVDISSEAVSGMVWELLGVVVGVGVVESRG